MHVYRKSDLIMTYQCFSAFAQYLFVLSSRQPELGLAPYGNFNDFNFGLPVTAFNDHSVAGLNRLVIADIIICSAAYAESYADKPVFRAVSLLRRVAV